ncbi:unnamed protein product [Prorocentrum cordatum]|nr:unnamed protein product [Polarella glacialis]
MCHEAKPVNLLLDGSILVVLGALKLVSQVLVAHKLEEGYCWRLARAVRVLSIVALASMSVRLVIFDAPMQLNGGVDMTDGGALLVFPEECMTFVIALAGVCYLMACVCGLCGLIGTAARVAFSPVGAQRRVARFVLLTAASLALSFASTVRLLVYSGIHEVEYSFAQWASAADALFECLTVALFSGLAGPTSLQVLARDAFSAINSYSDDQLQAFYEKYLEYLDEARVKWVRCGYLRALAAAGSAMPRCQEVPADHAVVGSSGFSLVRDGQKHRFVLSHPWLSREHPDPTGVKVRLLVDQLDRLGADDADAVFIDYMSLPQNDKQNTELQRLEVEQGMPKPGMHPAVRTEAEEAQFKQALSAMELIYSIGKTPVIVLPMDGAVERGREYISRGWCFLEFCLAMSFDNIANAEIHEPARRLVDDVKRLDGHTVDGFREAFKSKHFTNNGDADVVLGLFENTLNLASV